VTLIERKRLETNKQNTNATKKTQVVFVYGETTNRLDAQLVLFQLLLRPNYRITRPQSPCRSSIAWTGNGAEQRRWRPLANRSELKLCLHDAAVECIVQIQCASLRFIHCYIRNLAIANRLRSVLPAEYENRNNCSDYDVQPL